MDKNWKTRSTKLPVVSKDAQCYPCQPVSIISMPKVVFQLFLKFTTDLGDNSAILHKVEGIVIKWVHQVKNVLDLKSGQAIIDGKNPGPGEELKFWSELSSNLQCIYDQLVSPKVQKMARLLKDSVRELFFLLQPPTRRAAISWVKFQLRVLELC